jgi:hypothetical protein
VFVSTTVVVFPGAEADAVVVAAAEDLALRALALADEGPLLLTAALLVLLFPTQFAIAWLEIFLLLPYAWPNALAWGTNARFLGGGTPAHPRWLLRFLPPNPVVGPLGFRWFSVGVGVEAWYLERKCWMRAPPFGLSGLWLLYEFLWMVAGVVFVVCAWLGWFYGRLWGLAL